MPRSSSHPPVFVASPSDCGKSDAQNISRPSAPGLCSLVMGPGCWLLLVLVAAFPGCGPASSPTKPATTPTVPTVQTPTAKADQEVVFEDQAVTDELVATWLANKSLRRLKLAKSTLTDNMLTRLAATTQLEYLDLTDCPSITSAGYSAVGKLSTLKHLRISGPAVTDDTVAELRGLKNLAALSLQQTSITDAAMASVATFSKLKELNLYGSPITDAGLAPLTKLPQLQKLRLRGTRVTGQQASALAGLKQCADLDLSETEFGSAGLEHAARMPQLRQLNLWLTKVDDAGIKSLKSKTDLTLLNLDNVKAITNQSLEVIAQMPDLELLHLGGTSVTAEGLPQLYPLRNLKTLFITRLGLQESDVQALKEAMPWITRLEA